MKTNTMNTPDTSKATAHAVDKARQMRLAGASPAEAEHEALCAVAEAAVAVAQAEQDILWPSGDKPLDRQYYAYKGMLIAVKCETLRHALSALSAIRKGDA